MASEKVELTEEAIKNYLDIAIRRWRTRKIEARGENALVASCYIDAFQSVRTSLFGELLPSDTQPEGQGNE